MNIHARSYALSLLAASLLALVLGTARAADLMYPDGMTHAHPFLQWEAEAGVTSWWLDQRPPFNPATPWAHVRSISYAEGHCAFHPATRTRPAYTSCWIDSPATNRTAWYSMLYQRPGGAWVRDIEINRMEVHVANGAPVAYVLRASE